MTDRIRDHRCPDLLDRAGECGHAGADGANVDLDEGPQGDGIVGPGRVGCSAPVDDVVEADHAAEGDEQASKEGEANADFHARGDLDLQQARDGENEDDEVHGDVGGGAGVDLMQEVDAFTLVLPVPLGPGVGDRIALEGGGDGEAAELAEEEEEHDEAYASESVGDGVRENADYVQECAVSGTCMISMLG